MKPEAFNSPELRLLSPSSLLFFFLFLFCLLPSSSEAFSLHSSSHFSLNNVHPNKGFKFSPLFFSPLHAQQQQRPAFILESSTRMHAAETQPVQEAAGPAASAAPAEAAAEESAAAAKRFGAAPLAAAVFAEAELGAAAAVAAADAAAAAAEPAAPGPVALIAAPRGFCEGVSRAVGTVEKALEIYGPPVYVNHQIVHNEFVCKQLE
ncbi:lytB domain-containing protein, putative, partial [Eimeria acervulina]